MNPNEREQQKRTLAFVPPAGPRNRKSSRDLPLVKWTAWLIIAAFVLLVVWVLWAMATHEPSQVQSQQDTLD